MHKTLFSPGRLLLRSASVFIVCIIALSTIIPTARANGAPPPEPDMGGVAPYQPIETNVQMMSETVLIDVLPSPTRWTSTEFNWNANLVKVNASFTLRNQGQTEEKMQVIFPLSRLDYPWVTSSYGVVAASFVAKVDGKPVPITRVTTPPELQAVPENWDAELPDGFFVPDVQWAAFDVTFPVQKDVLVQVEYDMRGDITYGLHRIDYILETGAGWYGRILSGDIIVSLPYPATSESVPVAAAGYVFDGNEVRWHMENYEPKRKDNLTFGFIDTNEWSPTLELRARVEQYPDDADAWYKLGEKYERLGFFWGKSITNQHMVDLSIEAFEKVIALRREWGDGHLSLARALWYGNGSQNKRSVEDPVVQRVLLEVQLAASLGIDEHNYYYDNLVSDIRRAIPDLEPSLLPDPIRLPSASTPAAVTPESVSSSPQEIAAIAAGSYHTCVLTTGGDVKCRGWNLSTDVVGDVTAVVAGDRFTCMLTTAGGVRCMGENDLGQLGDGTTTYRAAPVDVPGLTKGVSALVAGDNHTCVLLKSGGVKCWGRNYLGQLGNGTTAYSLVPVDVNGLTGGVSALAAGSDHTCAFMQAGGIQCWGANESGQLGDGSLIQRLEPVEIVGLPGEIVALAAGFTHTCALNSQGQVMCWGDNSHGQLGDANMTVHTTPVSVPGLDGIVKVVAGNGYTCALTDRGGVKCWGKNDLYITSLCDETKADRPTPTEVAWLTEGAVDLVSGNDHLCAVLDNSGVMCWGVVWFGYTGPEADLAYGQAATPTALPELALNAPLPPATAAPTETSSPLVDFAWDLTLLIAIGVLTLLLRRSKSKIIR